MLKILRKFFSRKKVRSRNSSVPQYGVNISAPYASTIESYDSPHAKHFANFNSDKKITGKAKGIRRKFLPNIRIRRGPNQAIVTYYKRDHFGRKSIKKFKRKTIKKSINKTIKKSINKSKKSKKIRK